MTNRSPRKGAFPLKLEHVLFAILVLLLLVVVVLGSFDEPPHAVGLPHPDHGAMAMGGEATSRSAELLPWGLAFALLQVALFASLLLLGLRRGDEPVVRRYFPVLLGLAVLAICFVFLFAAYASFSENPMKSSIVLGFPAPTAWMLFGVWWSPIVVIVLYHRKFDTWVYGPREERAFRELMRSVSTESEDEGSARRAERS